MESVTYLPGRSLRGAWVLLDEAQDLQPSLAKTVLTRAAEGTKVVFTGDTSQIDAHNNAMSVLTGALGERAGGVLDACRPRVTLSRVISAGREQGGSWPMSAAVTDEERP